VLWLQDRRPATLSRSSSAGLTRGPIGNLKLCMGGRVKPGHDGGWNGVIGPTPLNAKVIGRLGAPA